jgi:chromosome segregation ATPase
MQEQEPKVSIEEMVAQHQQAIIHFFEVSGNLNTVAQGVYKLINEYKVLKTVVGVLSDRVHDLEARYLQNDQKPPTVSQSELLERIDLIDKKCQELESTVDTLRSDVESFEKRADMTDLAITGLETTVEDLEMTVEDLEMTVEDLETTDVLEERLQRVFDNFNDRVKTIESKITESTTE